MKKFLKVFLLFLVFIASTSGIFAQRTVTGTVSDAEKLPIIGANVVVKGTTIGTMTDINGKYSINVPSSTSIITYSFIGYVSLEMVAGNNAVLDVTLQTDALALEEVVVVGYGSVKKRDLTGSVASISGAQIAAVPVSNAAQAMIGKLPGVAITTQDGRPDASVSIRVRGGGSISQSNEPLFIVDGFPVGSISDIPGDQIESIDVLKDASSTAIYGARGANGVIIVTTKTAKAGKLTVSYDGYVQFNRPTKYLETMNAYDYIAFNWAYAKAIGPTTYGNAWEMLWGIGPQETAYNNPEGIDYYKNVTATNFSKESYGNSFSHSHNLNIGNGTEKTKYLFSVNYNDNGGMKINSWYKRVNASFKLDQKIGEKLNFSFDTRFADIDRMGNESTTNAKGSILSTAYQFRPIATADVKGELNDQVNTYLGMYDVVLQDRYNPVARMKDYYPENIGRSLNSNAALSWEVIKGLTARSELGLSNYWNKSKTWSGATYRDYLDPATGTKLFGGDAAIGSSEGWNIRWVNTLSYNVQGLGNNHTLNLMAGQEVTNSGSSSMNISGNKYPASFESERAFAMMDQYYRDPAVTNYSFSSNTGTPNRLISFFGRANYSLMNRYLLTATFRADGSSRFSPAHRWGYFPAAALGWRISEESFMKDISWISTLKLRASYGSVGNDGISANLWKSQWNSNGLSSYSINEVRQVSYSPQATISNPDLKWETTITRNIGIDFAFLKSRIFGTLDFYKNSTKDLLMLTNVTAISGSTATYANIGSTSNKGIEFAIGGDIVRSKDFTLSANININMNRGNVEELAPGVNGLYNTNFASTYIAPTYDYILVEGKPVGQVRGYTYDGWYTVDDFDYNATTKIYTLKAGVPDVAVTMGTIHGTNTNKPGGQVAYPGVIKLKDISGPAGVPDGVVNDFDVSIIGDMNPKHTGGFNVNGMYKGIDLGLNFNWSYGNKIYNANYLAALFGSKQDGLYRNRLDVLAGSYKIYEIVDGQLSFVTDPDKLNALNADATIYMPFQENVVVSTLGVQDGSFLRLNNVTLGYTLPKNLSEKVKISKLRVYGSIYNALTFTKYLGLDPEVNTNTSQGNARYPTTGLDWGSYPRARSFTLGLNIEF